MGDNHRQPGNISHSQLNAAIRERARQQLGNISRVQLMALGLSKGGIEWRLRNGSLVIRYTGVYAIAPPRPDPTALIAAAIVAGGPTAVASHASAAWLWGFVPHFERPLEISLPTGDRRPRHILTHRCPSVRPRDVTRQHGVPTTRPARTALDIAPRLTKKQLTRLVNDARHEGNLRPAALQDVVERNPLHPGTKLLIPFAYDTARPTDSPFEDDFKAFVKKYGLPQPEYNFPLNGRRLDVYFPQHGVIVELDGWAFHNDQEAFEDDRERDTDHLDHDLITVRITKTRFDATPDHEAARLHRILRRALAARPRP